MKRYYNSETKEWYTEGLSITRLLDNGMLFTGIPSDEQLTTWSFEELVESAPTSEQLLAQAKRNKIAELKAYDSSPTVNGFDVMYNGTTIENLWLTPDQRANYKNSLDSAELLGMEVVHPMFGSVIIEIPTQTAKIDLAKIQIYADQCYAVTETHKANINALETIEEVEAYNYNTNYPERLIFNI